VVIYSAIQHKPLTDSTVEGAYPDWANNLGLCMSITCVAVIPIYMAYKLIIAYMKGESIKAVISFFFIYSSFSVWLHVSVLVSEHT